MRPFVFFIKIGNRGITFIIQMNYCIGFNIINYIYKNENKIIIYTNYYFSALGGGPLSFL